MPFPSHSVTWASHHISPCDRSHCFLLHTWKCQFTAQYKCRYSVLQDHGNKQRRAENTYHISPIEKFWTHSPATWSVLLLCVMTRSSGNVYCLLDRIDFSIWALNQSWQGFAFVPFMIMSKHLIALYYNRIRNYGQQAEIIIQCYFYSFSCRLIGRTQCVLLWSILGGLWISKANTAYCLLGLKWYLTTLTTSWMCQPRPAQDSF